MGAFWRDRPGLDEVEGRQQRQATSRIVELERQLATADAALLASRREVDLLRDQLTAEHSGLIRTRDELAGARRELELCKSHPARHWMHQYEQERRNNQDLAERLAVLQAERDRQADELYDLRAGAR